MDALLIGPALALSFAGTLFAGKWLLGMILAAMEHRGRHADEA
jgi:hypothetical protein